MLKGYSVPRSPEGRASIVPAPPWHYAGDFLVLEYWANPEAVAAVLPSALKPYHKDPGRCAALFVDWQSCTDEGEELLDPIRAQYREFFIVVNALYGDELVTYCPYIWVDRDFALARGWIQGFPKKLGSIHITRTYDVPSRAASQVVPGARFAGTAAANDHRLAHGVVTLEKPSPDGPTHNAPPLMNVRHFPRLAAGQHDHPAVHELVRARSFNREIANIWEGTAELQLYPVPNEEHAALAPVRMGKGFRLTFGYSVDDLETVEYLRSEE
ncbi:acetoacetate decarboxylase family protein [Kyrpidia spormannii]|uniref:Acetoacetate decarboxylase n=2 Tax=Kyrpidia spormannii TaxID=2055160 RepID=A0ACA8ZC50_9BACL|nr:acetoacetate decarboxylase family protein [Kyrpidia spormannii]CAB3394642.1 Acetoacetate decarboxylase [Kyrpidia spormannii]CAB3395614.1 Acetoacetate decarboxylase [Kyrpidia spormannii]